MATHVELTKMITHLEHMHDKGYAKAAVSSSLNTILSLRIPMQNCAISARYLRDICAISASSGNVVCTAGTEFLLIHLRREKALLEH